MQNLYKILEIEKTDDARTIKKAYVKMLRKYPPEKSPEAFNKIREAYETLIDPISRAEYDAFYQYKDQIEEHYKIGNEALDNEDYKTAIKEYKKILIIEPNLTFAKYKLGLGLAYDKQYDLALIQFKELITINANNATYYSSIAYIYEKKMEYNKAEESLLKAYDIDPINDNIILHLSAFYIDRKQFKKAIDFLRNCIGKNKEDAFQDFIYYLEIVRVNIYESNIDEIENIIDEIERIIPDEEDARQYVAWKFGKLAYELYQVELYNLSAKISKRALEIDSSNEYLQELYKNSKELNQAIDLYNVLFDDNRVIGPLKGPIHFYLFSDKYEEDELKKSHVENIDAIKSYIDVDYDNVIKSIDILRKEYTLLYNYKQEIYKNIFELAYETKKLNQQLNKLQNDTNVTNPIVRLIALFMSYDLSEEEFDNYYKDIMIEMSTISNGVIFSSLNRIKNNYPELYKLNPDGLEKIKSIALKNNSSSSVRISSNSYRKDNTKTSNESDIKSCISIGFAIIGVLIIIGLLILLGEAIENIL